MASISERSFAQRYTKARELAAYLSSLSAYAPSSADLEEAKLTDLLNTIETANASVASTLSAVQTEQDERLTLYKDDNGLIKRSSQIRDYIASVLPSGKKARDFVKSQKIVQRMRGKRLTKMPPLKEDGTAAKTLSTYETSFGSLLGSARELLEVIKTVPGYLPSNTKLTVGDLTTFLDGIEDKNTLVAQKYEAYDDAADARAKLYNDLQDRITKIKLAIAAQYGKNSNEYKDVVKY